MTDLPTLWRAKADDYMRISKSYGRCSSTAAIKTGYVKAAAVLRECADELEHEHASQAKALGQDRERATEIAGPIEPATPGEDPQP